MKHDYCFEHKLTFNLETTLFCPLCPKLTSKDIFKPIWFSLKGKPYKGICKYCGQDSGNGNYTVCKKCHSEKNKILYQKIVKNKLKIS